MKPAGARLLGTLMGGAALGKLLGLVRELEMARLLGAGVVADSFRASLSIIILPLLPLQGDVMPAGLIPLVKEWEEKGKGPGPATAVVGIMALIGLALTATVALLAAPIAGLLLHGFSPEAHRQTVLFVQVMALAIPGSLLTTVLGAIEIAHGRSRLTALRASVQNLGVLGGLGLMVLTGEVMTIAWGFVAALDGVMLYGIVSLWRQGLIAPFAVRGAMLPQAGGEFFRRGHALLLLPMSEQACILVERSLGSTVALGMLASLDYARTLTETALHIVSYPVGYLVLARGAATGASLQARVAEVSRPLLVLVMPASAFCYLFATDIVSLVFQRGAFGAEAVALTAGVMRGIAPGLWAGVLAWVLIRMLNAAGRNRMAALIIVGAFAVNILVDFWAVPAFGAFGLGLGESARAAVLLGGTVVALGCAPLLLRLMAVALPCTVVLGLLALWLAAPLPTPLLRLGAGSLVMGLGVAAMALVWMPEQGRRLLALLRRAPATPGAA